MKKLLLILFLILILLIHNNIICPQNNIDKNIKISIFYKPYIEEILKGNYVFPLFIEISNKTQFYKKIYIKIESYSGNHFIPLNIYHKFIDLPSPSSKKIIFYLKKRRSAFYKIYIIDEILKKVIKKEVIDIYKLSSNYYYPRYYYNKDKNLKKKDYFIILSLDNDISIKKVNLDYSLKFIYVLPKYFPSNFIGIGFVDGFIINNISNLLKLNQKQVECLKTWLEHGGIIISKKYYLDIILDFLFNKQRNKLLLKIQGNNIFYLYGVGKIVFLKDICNIVKSNKIFKNIFYFKNFKRIDDYYYYGYNYIKGDIKDEIVKKVNLSWLIWIIVFYLICIGPIDYLINKITRKSLFSWIFFIGCVFIFSFIIYLKITVIRDTPLVLKKIDCIDILPNSNKYIGYTFFGIYSPLTAKYNMQITKVQILEEDKNVLNIKRLNFNRYINNIFYLDKYTLLFHNMSIYTFKFFSGQWTSNNDFYKLEINKISKDEVKINTNLNLISCYIIKENIKYKLEKINRNIWKVKRSYISENEIKNFVNVYNKKYLYLNWKKYINKDTALFIAKVNKKIVNIKFQEFDIDKKNLKNTTIIRKYIKF